MQVTSLLSHEHKHEPGCGCGHDHEHSVVHLWQTIAGVIFVANAWVVDWVFQQSATIASASAFVGAVILGYSVKLAIDKTTKTAWTLFKLSSPYLTVIFIVIVLNIWLF